MRFDYMAYAVGLARVHFQSAANILDVAPQGEEEASNGSIRSEIPGRQLPERSDSLRIGDQRLIRNQKSLQEIQGFGAANQELRISRQASGILDVADGADAIKASVETDGTGGEVSSSLTSPLQVHAGLLIAELELAVVRAELRAGTYAPIQERLEGE